MKDKAELLRAMWVIKQQCDSIEGCDSCLLQDECDLEPPVNWKLSGCVNNSNEQCEHKFVHLKTTPTTIKPATGGSYKSLVEVFYCEKCLETRELKI